MFVNACTLHWRFQVIGNGSFGVVSMAQMCDENKTPVAIKKVLQDRRYKVWAVGNFLSHIRFENVNSALDMFPSA